MRSRVLDQFTAGRGDAATPHDIRLASYLSTASLDGEDVSALTLSASRRHGSCGDGPTQSAPRNSWDQEKRTSRIVPIMGARERVLREAAVRQTLKRCGIAMIATLAIMTGLSFNAVPAGARTNSQDPAYSGGGPSGYSDQYSQRRFKVRGRGNGAWGRDNSYGNRYARNQDRNRSNNGCGGSRNGQWDQRGSWNEDRNQRGHGRSTNGWNRQGNQNGNGGWRDQGNGGD